MWKKCCRSVQVAAVEAEAADPCQSQHVQMFGPYKPMENVVYNCV